jgi:catechol 2,3-dioxygenase-like lactoylglutathione lyase family enzyme
MGLDSCRVEATVAVSDVEKAKEFYEGTLGLGGATEEPDGGVTYECAGGTRIHVYASPDNAGKSGATIAGFLSDDLDGTVDELTSKGVPFEQIEMGPIKTNEKGIAQFGDERVAWFKDPDGNIMGIASG